MNESMGINKLANMFMGNPAPLAQKVQQAQQQVKPGQIPPDLEEAMALQKIQEVRNASQNEQAMQAGGPQPTVLDKLRQMLGQQQQAQPQGQMPPQMAQRPPMPQGMPQGQPQMAPQGMPVRAAHGGHIAQLMSNLGNHYNGGGIVAFDGTSGSKVELSEERRKELELEQAMRVIGAQEAARQRAAAAAENPTEESGLMRPGPQSPLAGIKESLSGMGSRIGQALRGKQLGTMNLDSEAVEPAPTAAPAAAPAPIADLKALAAATQRPAAPRPAAPRPAAPAAPQIPGTPYNPADATRRADFPQVNEEDKIIQERMRQDPEEKRRAEIARINEMIGKPDNSAVLETIAALKAKREKAQTSADPLMDLLGGIASARPGQKWWQSGVAGSEYAASKAAQREAADTAYLEQILGHQQKVNEAERGYKTQLYTASSAAADRAAKEVYDAAVAAGKSKEEAAKLAQEERIRMLEMASREKTNAATNAAHLAAAGMQKGPTYADQQREGYIKDWLARPENKGKSPLEAAAMVSNMLSGRDAKQTTAQEALQIKREQLIANNPLYMQQYRIALTETDPVKKKRAEDILKEIEKKSGLDQTPSANIPPPPPNAVKRIG